MNRPLTEVEEAYLAVCEDLLLFGTPEGIDWSRESVCAIIRGGISILDVRPNLVDAAVYLLRETRRRYPGSRPLGILNATTARRLE